MKFVGKQFQRRLPQAVLRLFEEILGEKVRPTLVGGCVRDYLLTGVLPKDIDMEIRWEGEDEGEKGVEKLAKVLRKQYGHEVNILSFGVLRLQTDGLNIEMAPPRVEMFERSDWYGHSDFRGVVRPNLPFADAWKRRDFTVNAIGIEVDKGGDAWKFSLVDPFGGVGDLEKRVLRPCGEDFFKDPVRFLRLIRFQLALDFKPDAILEERIGEFNLKGLTNHYLFSEAEKSNFTSFFARLFDCVEEKGIVLPSNLVRLRFLGSFHRPDGDLACLANLEEFLVFLVFHPAPPAEKDLRTFCREAGLREKILTGQQRLRTILGQADQLNGPNLREQAKKLPVEDFLNLEEVALLKAFGQNRLVFKKAHLEILEKIHPKLYQSYCALDDLAGGTLSGEKLFKELAKKVAPYKRGELRIYCHLASV